MNTENSLIHQLIKIIRLPRNEHLAVKFGASAFAVGFLVYLIDLNLLANNDRLSLILSHIGAISFFALLGLDGFIVMIRKELLQIVMIRGRLAMAYGLVWCSFSWVLALYYVFLFLDDVLHAL